MISRYSLIGTIIVVILCTLATIHADNHPSHVIRSASARRAFRRMYPCPATGLVKGACPGYVIDHIIPLKRGGVDAPSNMQWQTTAEAKAKDRTERIGCR